MTHNRLSSETSPYLLQHKDNPVHWWAWGPDALAHAKETGKPILLSVGYAACHWCHVMAHESFEDATTAGVMNALFVNIKVDREERPDIDAIYMGALHYLGEQGGWPLTMFLDSDARPFFGGTYFPKQARFGRPAFVDLLKRVALAYSEDRKRVNENATAILRALTTSREDGPFFKVSDAAIADLARRLCGAVDTEKGGLKGAPKFPQWSIFWLLWRAGIRFDNEDARRAVLTTLTHICQGGIYDHLGGGFARYSVDEDWLVPHFEKMLYDNALLIDLLTEAHAETGDALYAQRVAETVGWVEQCMAAPEGGFAASWDADSEGVEGKFYVWTAKEIAEVLGADDARFFCETYGVTPEGNWEGDHHAPSEVPTTILNRLGGLALLPPDQEDRLSKLRVKLLAERETKRVRPGFDDKVLADWNGLMIAALASAGVHFRRPECLKLAEDAFAFVSTRMTEGGRLKHAYRAGKLSAPATSADYANMIAGAIALYCATLKRPYLDAALGWVGVLDTHYATDAGGYATSADDTADVIVRLSSAHDDAMPNANAMMLANLMHLFELTGDVSLVDRADAIQRAFAADVARNVVGHCGFLAQAVDLIAPQLVVISGGTGAQALADAVTLSLPGALVVRLGAGADDLAPGLQGKGPIASKAAGYLCLGPQCSAPVTEAAALRDALADLRRAPVPA